MSIAPVRLRCEARVNPQGIDERRPRLSWVIKSDLRDQRQSAFRVVVSSGDETLWDTGKVVGDETINLVYDGKPLCSAMRCEWKVKVWDGEGRESEWSESAGWSMGLLEESEWTAQWIGYDAPRKAMTPAELEARVVPPAVCLRKAFTAGREVARATLYATGIGVFDILLNGQRVTGDWFNPGWTDYTKRVYYRTYDATALVVAGDNLFEAVVADGWYSGFAGYEGKRDHYGKHPRVKAELHLEFVDGSTAVVATGPDWMASTGPTIHADFFQGETYDARLEPGDWQLVDTGAEVAPLVQAHPGPPVVVIGEFRAQSITEPSPGVYVLDLGQNFAGVARLKVAGRAGQKITLRFAERLNPDGTVYTANLRSARATDTYICRGGGVEEWTPRFTFHGFQYIEVTGLEEAPDRETVVGLALGSDTPVVGAFECSDPMVNRLHRNVYWTQRANFLEVPTDCPQRDERLGWTGDAQVFIRTAALNCDVQAFFAKWLVDVVDAQREDGQFARFAPRSRSLGGDDGGPAWSDGGVICPWTIYEVYGDRRVLERSYDSMVAFVEFCRRRCTPELLPPETFHCWGDWLSIKADTPKEVIFEAYFAHSTTLLALSAEVLGKTEDAAKYRELFREIKAAFNKAYVGPDGRIKGDTQCVYVLALAFDLLDGGLRELAAKYLVGDIESRGNHLSTGFVGTKDLMLVLAKIGRNDVACRLLHNETFPSWGFSIKHGATSIWERWNGWTPEDGFGDPAMNSFAHYSFGAVHQWIAENIGGIRNGGNFYRRIVIAPYPDPRMQWARTIYESVRGLIVSEWKRDGAAFHLHVEIPANTTAMVILPGGEQNAVGSGCHSFESFL